MAENTNINLIFHLSKKIKQTKIKSSITKPKLENVKIKENKNRFNFN